MTKSNSINYEKKQSFSCFLFIKNIFKNIKLALLYSSDRIPFYIPILRKYKTRGPRGNQQFILQLLQTRFSEKGGNTSTLVTAGVTAKKFLCILILRKNVVRNEQRVKY